MFSNKELPKKVIDKLQKQEIDISSIKSVISSNKSLNSKTWLAVNNQSLIKITTENKKNDKIIDLKPYLTAKQKKYSNINIVNVETISLSEIEKLNIIKKVNSNSLIAKLKNDKMLLLTHYPKGGEKDFAQFKKLVNKLIKEENLDEEQIKQNEDEGKCPDCGNYYPNPVRKVCPKCLDKKSLFKRILNYTVNYRKPLMLILFLMILSNGLSLISPYVGGRLLFDDVLTEGGRFEGQIGMIVLVMFSTRLASVLLNIVQGRINARISAKVIYDLKKEIFSALQELSLSFFTGKETGVLMNRVNSDARQIKYLFLRGIPMFIINFLKLLGISIIMFWMNWQLSLIILLPVPLTIYIIKKIYPKLRSMFRRRWKKRAFLNSVVNNAITGIRVVKAFGKEDSEIDRYQKNNQNYYNISVKTGYFTGAIFPFMSFFMGIGSYLVWGVGGWQVLTGSITFGTLITFVGYTTMFYGPIRFMTQIVDWWSETMNAVQRVFAIIDSDSKLERSENPVHLPDIKGEVKIDNVSFCYEESQKVLKEINLEVESGEIIGLVGHSGAGKTTLTSLIARLYDVDEGKIYIDGVKIKDIKINDLRRQIGIVLQDDFLFKGTVAENIAYSQPEVDLKEIIYAAKIANAHDFIVDLSEGYDTVLGAGGQDLSGGQKQRLSIARAILHDPAILILDEATSNVDTETEQKIQQALDRLMAGRTTFVIAHRLSTLKNADRLFVLKKGENVESGTHKELIKKEGEYYKLYKKQREALKVQGVGYS